jgi:hypothetical protein
LSLSFVFVFVFVFCLCLLSFVFVFFFCLLSFVFVLCFFSLSFVFCPLSLSFVFVYIDNTACSFVSSTLPFHTYLVVFPKRQFRVPFLSTLCQTARWREKTANIKLTSVRPRKKRNSQGFGEPVRVDILEAVEETKRFLLPVVGAATACRTGTCVVHTWRGTGTSRFCTRMRNGGAESFRREARTPLSLLAIQEERHTHPW